MRRVLGLQALLLAACTSYQPPSAPAPGDGTTVKSSRGRTWDAVISQFAARNIPIRAIERVSGLIVTDELVVGPEGTAWADCGAKNNSRLRPNHATYNVLVLGDSQTSTVKATVQWTLVADNVTRPCSTTHAWEQWLEELVRADAESQQVASLRASPQAAEQHSAAPSDTTGAPAVPIAGGSSGTASTKTFIPTVRLSSPSVPAPRLPPLRTNAELLRDADVRHAVSDIMRLGLAAAWREIGRDTLEMDLAEQAFRVTSLPYHLGRLYGAYTAVSDPGRAPALELRRNGKRIGEYNEKGLLFEGQNPRPQ